MAMSMKGHVLLPATREVVWDRLNDPATLKACIPGCQSLERTGENAFAAVAKVKVGPVNATFRGNVELSDLDPPNGYRISGGGEGGIAGFAKGNARPHGSETVTSTSFARTLLVRVPARGERGCRTLLGSPARMSAATPASAAPASCMSTARR
jgi:carbon monoxide dehydrogenase subunit G